MRRRPGPVQVELFALEKSGALATPNAKLGLWLEAVYLLSQRFPKISGLRVQVLVALVHRYASLERGHYIGPETPVPSS